MPKFKQPLASQITEIPKRRLKNILKMSSKRLNFFRRLLKVSAVELIQLEIVYESLRDNDLTRDITIKKIWI